MTRFDRYGPALAAVHFGLLLVAVHFGLIVFVGGSPMGPEVYGPAVYAIPALVWIGAQVGGEALMAFGLFQRGRSGAWAAIVGGGIILPFYGFLGAAASYAGQGVIVTAACVWLTAPLALASICLGVEDLRRER